MNRVRVGFFSLSATLGAERDRSYLEWHQLDHMPEQYQIPGLLHGQRWLSTSAGREARLASGDWERVDHVVLYLMGDPVEETLDRFMRLGAALREAGRYPVALPSVFAGTTALEGAAAAPTALVSDEVVPWRPNRGIYLIVEEAGAEPVYDGLLGIPGVAGIWRFATAERYRRWQATAGDYRMTVVYLDGDTRAVSARIGHVLTGGREGGTDGLLLAAPFEALVPWAWGPLSSVLEEA